MRLINVHTLQLKEFITPPPYAILSHRWTDEEVSYQEYCLVLRDARYTDEQRATRPWLEERTEEANKIKERAGYHKILRFCEAVRNLELEQAWIREAKPTQWAWADTVWYYKSTCCYVHPNDVEEREPRAEEIQFLRSEWFTRGWTLQELIAPRRLLFLRHDWTEIILLNKGSIFAEHGEAAFFSLLADASRVPQGVLWNSRLEDLRNYSVSERFSWAANRQTTRTEDQAYCLLGLFDVSMPLLYGEGSKAFLRLQHQILQRSEDPTIFVWRLPQCFPELYRETSVCGSPSLLALNLKCFRRGNLALDPPAPLRLSGHSRPSFWKLDSKFLELYAPVTTLRQGTPSLTSPHNTYPVAMKRLDDDEVQDFRNLWIPFVVTAEPYDNLRTRSSLSTGPDASDVIIVRQRWLSCRALVMDSRTTFSELQKHFVLLDYASALTVENEDISTWPIARVLIPIWGSSTD